MNLEAIAQELNQKALEESKRSRVEFFKEIYTTQFSRASTYISLITGAGYAGFFTAWDKMKPLMPTKIFVAAGLAVVISLLFFIFWEVWKMLYTAFSTRKGLAAVTEAPAEKYDEFLLEYKKLQIETDIKLMSVWRIFLILILVPAIFGTSLLVWGFISSLLA